MIAKTLETPHLRLFPATADHVLAELEDRGAFARILDAAVPSSWPPGEYDEAAQRYFLSRLQSAGSEADGWFGWYVVRKPDGTAPATLVAIAGFYGPPSAEGVVEIGYSVCPEWRRRGYATEAVRALTAHVFATAGVGSILAHAYDAKPESVRVLERCGYTRLGPGTQPGVVRFAFGGEEEAG